MQCFALQLMRFPQRGAWSRVLHVDIFKYSQRVRERCREENRKQEKALLERLSCPVWGDWSSVHGFVVKNLPALQEIWVWSLGQENSWRMEWQPTPVFLSGESHGQRSLVGYSPYGRKESDTTERLTLSLSSCPVWGNWSSVTALLEILLNISQNSILIRQHNCQKHLSISFHSPSVTGNPWG